MKFKRIALSIPTIRGHFLLGLQFTLNLKSLSDRTTPLFPLDVDINTTYHRSNHNNKEAVMSHMVDLMAAIKK